MTYLLWLFKFWIIRKNCYFFVWFWWGFLQMIPYKNLTKVTPVLRIIWVKMIMYPVKLLCPALYRVQHITVSSTLLCLTKYCVHNYPKFHLFTFRMSTCCIGIMLRLRSTLVFNCFILKFVFVHNIHVVLCLKIW